MPDDKLCQFDDMTLLNYLRNTVATDVRRTIEQSPDCMEAAQRLATEMEVLKSLLRETLCPDIDSLIDYQEGRLSGRQRLVVFQHVRHCQHCQAELAMFGAIDAVTSIDQPSWMRRVVEAFFQSPTLSPAPVRGGMLLYRTQIRTPQIDILLRSTKATGKSRTWAIYGQLRTSDGQQFTEFERAILQSLDEPRHEAIEAIKEGSGAFTLKGLTPGRYSLQIRTTEEDIIIHELKVGDDA